jgi:hypothetical protein
VKYELSFNIPEDDILHSYRRESLKSYTRTVNFSSVSSVGAVSGALSATSTGKNGKYMVNWERFERKRSSRNRGAARYLSAGTEKNREP